MENKENIKELFKRGAMENIRKSLFGYHYIPDGKRVVFHETYIDQKDLQKMRQFMENSDQTALKGVHKQELSTIRVQCFVHADGRIAWVQLSEFVPHLYVPLTDVVKLEGTASTAIAEMLGK